MTLSIFFFWKIEILRINHFIVIKVASARKTTHLNQIYQNHKRLQDLGMML